MERKPLRRATRRRRDASFSLLKPYTPRNDEPFDFDLFPSPEEPGSLSATGELVDIALLDRDTSVAE